MNLRQRKIVGISLFLVWVFAILAPVIQTSSGQYNANYGNICKNNPPGYTCTSPSPGIVTVYYNGILVSQSDCNVPNAICLHTVTYFSLLRGYEYTVNPEPCSGSGLCAMNTVGNVIALSIDFILIVIALWAVLRYCFGLRLFRQLKEWMDTYID